MKKMYKVKIFEVTNEWSSCDQCEMHKTTFHDYTNWEEVSEDELATLNQWVWNKNVKQRYSADKKLILITESEYTVPKALKEYIEQAQIDNAKRLEREAKLAARQEKLRATREARKLLEKARQILAQAQAEDK